MFDLRERLMQEHLQTADHPATRDVLVDGVYNFAGTTAQRVPFSDWYIVASAAQQGFADRPVHPIALVNFGLSFSVHDVSEQAIAHLAYIDVRFRNACRR